MTKRFVLTRWLGVSLIATLAFGQGNGNGQGQDHTADLFNYSVLRHAYMIDQSIQRMIKKGNPQKAIDHAKGQAKRKPD
jgi:hypothetical protein